MGFWQTTIEIVCKYSFLVLIFSLLGALQIHLFEPPFKKAMKIGDPSEHEVKWEIILMKFVGFVTGVLLLIVLFGKGFFKCTKRL
jgi:hypothetical protein